MSKRKSAERIVKKEDGEVLRGVLLELVQMDEKNADRVILLYNKQ